MRQLQHCCANPCTATYDKARFGMGSHPASQGLNRATQDRKWDEDDRGNPASLDTFLTDCVFPFKG